VKEIRDRMNDLSKEVYKMFIWNAKPNKSYLNPYFVFLLGFIGILYSASTNNKSLGIFMCILMILALMTGDYIKGEWKGYMRKVLKQKEGIK